MLSPHDDFPVHQTPEPIAQPSTSDRNFYDRHWMNGFDRDGSFYFGVALAVYPNRRIMDCSFSAVRDGEQHAFHASRIAPLDRAETRVGPFSIEVQEPMRRLRVRLEPNETGIEADLVFAARTAAVEEGRTTLRRDGRVLMDSTRFTQWGRWEGSFRAGGRSSRVDPERVCATRDRSWGVRPVGEPEQGGAPGDPPQVFFLWAPLHFDDHCTHFAVFENADGSRWHQDGMIVPAYESVDALPGIEDPALEHLAGGDYRLSYVPGTRRAESAVLELRRRGGETRRIELEPLLRFQMTGLGYTNFEWGHGYWKGDGAIGAESWKLDALDPLALQHLHVQQVVRARSEGREGVGVLEQLCIGPHAPSGFRGLVDGAR